MSASHCPYCNTKHSPHRSMCQLRVLGYTCGVWKLKVLCASEEEVQNSMVHLCFVRMLCGVTEV